MATTELAIHGDCAPEFEPVREAFAANFAAGLEVGASVSVTVDGSPAVDLWAGYADAARTRPWERDTIVRVYSTTKGWTATLMHMLADRSLVDLDAPVATYWPEFAQGGKQAITIAQVLDHSAGLAAVSQPLTPDAAFDWDTMIHALEVQEPWWEPGTDHGYHAITFGWLLGEVIRRVTGKTPGTFLQDEVARPLGFEMYIGFGPEIDERVADMLPPRDNPNAAVREDLAGDDPTSLDWNVWMNPPRPFTGANSRESRAAEMPASNGHSNARSIARLYGALACGGELDGVRLLSPEAIARASLERCWGPDRVLRAPGATTGMRIRRGLGFLLWNDANAPDPRSRSAFGHTGAGGSFGFADPEHRLGFGYAMNQAGSVPDPRAPSIVEALYRCL